MSNEELKAQFDLCKIWQDAEQWFALACAYLARGYDMNAVYCFRQSEACGAGVAVETKEEEAEADQILTTGLHYAWQSILRHLRAEIPRVSFDTWVRDTSPVHCGEGKLQIAARNAFAIDWLSSRMTDTINHLLDGLQVEFVVGVATEVEMSMLEEGRGDLEIVV